MISTTLGRPRSLSAAIADLISPVHYYDDQPVTTTINVAWVSLLCLDGAIADFIIALGDGAGRLGDTILSEWYCWIGFSLLLFPFVGRLLKPSLSRSEQVILLVLLTEFLYFTNILYSPVGFTQYDEMLHWISAHAILYRHKLFLDNTMLPISPYYPGLELITTAFANLAGLKVFPAAIMVMPILRGSFMLTLFLFLEKVSGSARIASIACLIYMSGSTYIIFDASFAYESLAIVFCLMVMLAETEITTAPQMLVLFGMLVAAMAVTHHVTAIFCALYLIGIGVVGSLCRSRHGWTRGTIMIAALAVLLPLSWILFGGDRLFDYLQPAFHRDISGVYEKLNGQSKSRQFFVSANGQVQPLANRLIAIISTLAIVIGLSTGFFRALILPKTTSGWQRLWSILHRQWSDSRIILLTIGAFGYPISVLSRISGTGWEIGNRMGTFVFISVGFVVATSVVHFWQPRLMKLFPRRAHISLTAAVGTLILGGILIAAGPHPVHDRYEIVGDAESIEPMGIEASQWTKSWLGQGNRFASDRDNQTLLATYGDQHVISNLQSGINLPQLFFSRMLSDAFYPLQVGDLEYLLVDLRLTQGPSMMGEYYGIGDADLGPPDPRSLLKFDESSDVSRVFDNGWIVIYNVKGLR